MQGCKCTPASQRTKLGSLTVDRIGTCYLEEHKNADASLEPLSAVAPTQGGGARPGRGHTLGEFLSRRTRMLPVRVNDGPGKEVPPARARTTRSKRNGPLCVGTPERLVTGSSRSQGYFRLQGGMSFLHWISAPFPQCARNFSGPSTSPPGSRPSQNCAGPLRSDTNPTSSASSEIAACARASARSLVEIERG
jgi:hypothetical protein